MQFNAFLNRLFILLLLWNSPKFVGTNEEHKIYIFYSPFFFNGISSHFFILYVFLIATKFDEESCDDVESGFLQEINIF